MKCSHLKIAVPLILALACAGCGSSSGTAGSPPNASSSTSTPQLPASPATELAGFPSVLTVEHEVDVLAQRDGTVTQIVHDEGTAVKSGEVLALLDDRDIQAQLAKAKADLQVSEYNVKYNEAELKAKQANYRRYQQLREMGLSSQADLEQAEFQAKGAEYDLKSWQAVVERSQATIREMEAELDKTRIRAPFSGVVARRYLRQGQGVIKDQKCFHVSQLSPLQVQFSVPQSSGPAPRVGELVSVVITNDSGRTYVAKIVKLSPTINPASGAYDVTAQLNGPDLSSLRPGMAARVTWPTTASTRR